MSDFVSRVRNGKIYHPTQKLFSLDDWEKTFAQTSNRTDEDTKLYESGKWAFEKFELIRKQLKHFNLEDISTESVIRMLVSLTNRTTHTLSYMSLPIIC